MQVNFRSYFFLTTCSLSLMLASLSALEIEIRYDLDTTNFFDPTTADGIAARQALEAATEFFEDIIVDEIEAIDPNQFGNENWIPTYIEPVTNTVTSITSAQGLLVPADTIIIFAAARPLDLSIAATAGPGSLSGITSFEGFNQIHSRNEPGGQIAFTGPDGLPDFTVPSDFATWGGSVFFNGNLDWNFSATDASIGGPFDFLSIALHEIIHILGVLGANAASPYFNFTTSGSYTGGLGLSSHGNTPLGVTADRHLETTQDSAASGAFGRTHGEPLVPLMLAATSSTTATEFSVPTDLDLAILRDIGWELSLTGSNSAPEVDLGGSSPSVDIATNTGLIYKVLRSETLAASSLNPAGDTIIGDGTVQTWTDPSTTSAAKAFFQLEVSQADPPASLVTPSKEALSKKELNVQYSTSGNPIVLPEFHPAQCACRFGL